MFRSYGICRAGNGARRSFASGATHARRCPPQRSLSPKGTAGTLFAAALRLRLKLRRTKLHTRRSLLRRRVAAAAKLLPALRFDVTGTCGAPRIGRSLEAEHILVVAPALDHAFE